MNKKPKTHKPPRFKDKVKHEVIANKRLGLLEFLLLAITNESRNNLKAYLARGQITVNGAPIRQFDFLLSPGDIIRVEDRPIKRVTSKIKLKVLYEDEQLVAINKPAGLLSVASDQEKNITAYRLVNDYVQLKDPHTRIFVVHRLDKETSGVLLFAKDNEIRNILQKKWNQLVRKRGYYAITIGVPTPANGTLKDYLFTNSTSLMYVGKRSPGSVLAITNYQVIKDNEKFALLDVNIETGKKNQIRVQLKHFGYPLIGDEKYESGENPLNRLGLHAYQLSLVHPITGKIVKINAPLPAEFNKIFQK
ncbi:MAG: RluA family pseudouridine synthase [Bacilli bacterium]|jgi:23S rRNA pseudouridine1911/1915/1917 synthase|nr:RluA family pseudouridine synthase [Bacilli bacterium]MDD3389423.1 RluA family pseudouridine synthase [Bacilli bacterium]MDD4344824.1 RluA family pseudouridine synthase [Bacilli bacterium]MDD4520790.1 RluA family pseudouridine synthase [Bacilli bacterium]MDY0399436.1 RluA family pseudouridine synthase [Bacilli bacterium]